MQVPLIFMQIRRRDCLFSVLTIGVVTDISAIAAGWCTAWLASES